MERVNQICPPQFDLYQPAGYYDRAHGKLKFDVIEKAKKDAAFGNLSMDNELHYNDSYPAVRAWNLSVEEIRRDGALFNMYRGALSAGLTFRWCCCFGQDTGPVVAVFTTAVCCSVPKRQSILIQCPTNAS
jgi:hypothetical protein